LHWELWLIIIGLLAFRSVVAYRTTVQPVFTPQSISQGNKLSLYDSVDEEVLRSYREFSLASLVYFAMKESACSEQSQRMTAMDSATKNAGTFIVLCAFILFASL
jgi:F-type H+-transporting ATPase subunit gamma